MLVMPYKSIAPSRPPEDCGLMRRLSADSSQQRAVSSQAYNPQQARTRAAVKWLLCKAFNCRVPEEFLPPFYKDEKRADKIKPSVVHQLANGELYRLALATMYGDPASFRDLNHRSLVLFLCRKGCPPLRPDDEHGGHQVDSTSAPSSANHLFDSSRDMTEASLMQTTPLKINAHMSLIEALMQLFLRDCVPTDSVRSAVDRFRAAGLLNHYLLHVGSQLDVPSNSDSLTDISDAGEADVTRMLQGGVHLHTIPSTTVHLLAWISACNLAGLHRRRQSTGHMNILASDVSSIVNKSVDSLSSGVGLLSALALYCPSRINVNQIDYGSHGLTNGNTDHHPSVHPWSVGNLRSALHFVYSFLLTNLGNDRQEHVDTVHAKLAAECQMMISLDDLVYCHRSIHLATMCFLADLFVVLEVKHRPWFLFRDGLPGEQKSNMLEVSISDDLDNIYSSPMNLASRGQSDAEVLNSAPKLANTSDRQAMADIFEAELAVSHMSLDSNSCKSSTNGEVLSDRRSNGECRRLWQSDVSASVAAEMCKMKNCRQSSDFKFDKYGQDQEGASNVKSRVTNFAQVKSPTHFDVPTTVSSFAELRMKRGNNQFHHSTVADRLRSGDQSNGANCDQSNGANGDSIKRLANSDLQSVRQKLKERRQRIEEERQRLDDVMKQASYSTSSMATHHGEVGESDGTTNGSPNNLQSSPELDSHQGEERVQRPRRTWSSPQNSISPAPLVISDRSSQTPPLFSNSNALAMHTAPLPEQPMNYHFMLHSTSPTAAVFCPSQHPLILSPYSPAGHIYSQTGSVVSSDEFGPASSATASHVYELPHSSKQSSRNQTPQPGHSLLSASSQHSTRCTPPSQSTPCVTESTPTSSGAGSRAKMRTNITTTVSMQNSDREDGKRCLSGRSSCSTPTLASTYRLKSSESPPASAKRSSEAFVISFDEDDEKTVSNGGRHHSSADTTASTAESIGLGTNDVESSTRVSPSEPASDKLNLSRVLRRDSGSGRASTAKSQYKSRIILNSEAVPDMVVSKSKQEASARLDESVADVCKSPEKDEAESIESKQVDSTHSPPDASQPDEVLERMRKRQERFMMNSVRRRQRTEELRQRNEEKNRELRLAECAREEQRMRRRDEVRLRREMILKQHRDRQNMATVFDRDSRKMSYGGSYSSGLNNAASNRSCPPVSGLTQMRGQRSRRQQMRPRTISGAESLMKMDHGLLSPRSETDSCMDVIDCASGMTTPGRSDIRGSRESINSGLTYCIRRGSSNSSLYDGTGMKNPGLYSPSVAGSLRSRSLRNSECYFDDGASDVSSVASGFSSANTLLRRMSGGSTTRLYREPTVKSNRSIIVNALEHVVFAGAVNATTRVRVLDAVDRASDAGVVHFLILFRDAKCQFRGLYAHINTTAVASNSPSTTDSGASIDYEADEVAIVERVIKLYGAGPRQVSDDMFDMFYKYNSSGKKFARIHTRHVTATIDAFTIHNNLWLGKRLPTQSSLSPIADSRIA